MSYDQIYNIGRAFQKIARDYPAFPAIISEQATISNAQLFAVVVSFAQRMQALGIGRGSLVALNTGDTVASLATLMATSLLGSRFVVTSKVLAKQKPVQPTHFLKTAEASGKSGVAFIEIDKSWLPQHPISASDRLDAFEGYADADDPWMYLTTSGTTGTPKTLSLSPAAVFGRTMAVGEDFPVARTTMASLFGNTSRPFYARALGALLHAGTIVDSLDPGVWRATGVNVVFGSPRQFEQFLDETSIPTPIARVEVSGAKLTDELAVRLSGVFRHITDVYGASETSKSYSNIVTVTAEGKVVRVGKPLDSIVEIVDDQSNPCAAGVEGYVRVRNGYMSSPYLNAPKANAKAFVDGWFYPGDVARLDASGALQVIGRTDDILSFGGLKLNAALIDMIFKLTPGVQDAICFKNPKTGARNEIMGYVVFEPLTDRAACVRAIRENYQRELKLPCFLGNIHAIDKIPRTAEGKLMRAFCQNMVLERAEGLSDAFEP
jgi:acyl-coenzyme A synthetase/AMP-(fatty) acid ligase